MTGGRRLLRGGRDALAFALGAPLLAAVFQRLLPEPVPSRFPLLTFIAAVCIVAAWRGRTAGLLSVPLAGVLAARLAAPGGYDWLVFGVAQAVGLLLVLAIGGAREARRRVEEELKARAAAEAAARESRQQLDAALDAARMGYFTGDPRSGAVTYSRNLERLHGVPTGALGGSLDSFLAVVHPEDRARVAEAVGENLRNGTPYDIEFRVPWPDGTIHHVNGRGHLLRGSADEPGRAYGFVVDVTDRHRADEAQRWLASIVASSDDAVIGQDVDGRILSWNAGAERLFGWSAAEAIGRPASLIVPDGLEEDFDGLLDRVRRGERLEHFETRRRRRDGAVRDLSLTVSPVRDGSGRVVGLSKIARDVTERTREARDKERTRDLFLGTLGHDLRNPLNTIVVSAHALRREAPPAAVRPLERILSSARRMSRMIDQLLDVARSRLGGGIPVSRRPADLFEICAAVADELDAGSAPRFRIARSGATGGCWDPDRLAQAVGNILGNAVEHGEPGAPVDVALHGDEAAVSLRVTNRGPAIPGELLPHLFDPFRSGHRRRGAGSGLGLGLYIAEQIVTAHGGTIAVESRPGEVTLSVALPRTETRAV